MSINMRSFITLLLSLSTIMSAIGQNAVVSPAIDLSEHIPQSPSGATLGKYFEFPVNMSTGIPLIEIPIYTIKSGNIVLPIKLRYHAGGIKINECASWVGMNWSLDLNNSITKRVNGLDDFYTAANTGNSSTLAFANPDYTADLPGINIKIDNITTMIDTLGSQYGINNSENFNKFFGRIAQGYIDGEADEFFYSTPEGGGMFYYNQKKKDFETQQINGWKVESGGDFYDQNSIPSFNIYSNNGIFYGYDIVEEAENPLYYKAGSLGLGAPTKRFSPTAFYMSTAVDQATGKSISITYNTDYGKTLLGYTLNKEYNLQQNYGLFSLNKDMIYRQGTEITPKAITFENGRLEFIRDSNKRLDGGVRALKEINVYNNNNRIVKKFAFEYFYDTANINTCSSIYVYNEPGLCDTLSKRLFLKSIQELNYEANNNIIKNPPYIFTYDMAKKLPCRLSFAQDHWGYYNGKISNTTLIPKEPMKTLTGATDGADREIDTAFAKAGTLSAITYPTGSKATFLYENNRTQSSWMGGLRIKNIINYDNVGQKNLTTEYEYINNNGISTGVGGFIPSYYYIYRYTPSNDNPQGSSLILKVSNNPIYPLFSYQNSSILYKEVTKKIKGISEDLCSKHYFTTENDFSIEKNTEIRNLSTGVPYNKYTNLDALKGIEYKTELLKRDSNGIYTVTNTHTNEYTTLKNFSLYQISLQVGWGDDFGGTQGWVWNNHDPYVHIPIWPTPSYNGYFTFREKVVNSRSEDVNFDNALQIKNSTNYIYDPETGNLKISRSTNSYGDTIIQVTNYVSDFPNTNNAIGFLNQIYQLHSVNAISKPIEIVRYLKKKNATDSTLIEATHYEYIDKKIKKIYKLPINTSISNFQMAKQSNQFSFDSRYQLEQEIIDYDIYSNPTTLLNRKSFNSLIWDINSNSVIAFTTNSTNQNVASSSFESDSKGNFSFNGIATVDATAPTGKKVYNLTSGSISKTGLNAAKTYVVSYWSKSGPQNVNSTNATAGPVKNGWTLYQHIVNNPANGTITISGIGTIDELRLYPKEAQMTTYTYEPLIGMTSQCNANNQISYYEYDGLGRLNYIRDQDKNVIKKICYNYAGQPENCDTNIVYYNQQLSKSFIKNNCPPGYISTPVNYIVPAGKYTSKISQADADAQAQADINSNGQIYANTIGSCFAGCAIIKCVGEGKKCINGICETGKIIVTDSWFGKVWNCTYHYKWSDGSISQDYQSSDPLICNP